MELNFSVAQMQDFLRKRGYKIAQYPCHILLHTGPTEREEETTATIAIRNEAGWEAVKKLYWWQDIDRIFGLEHVFEEELKLALIRL